MLSRMIRRLGLRPSPAAGAPARRAQRRPLGFEALEPGEVPALVYALATDNTLLSFDSADPTAILNSVTITGLQGTATEHVIGLDFRPRTGGLVASTADSGIVGAPFRTYSIDPLTGVATLIGEVPSGAALIVNDVESGYDFNPTVDRIRVVNVDDQNFRINPNDGTLAGGAQDTALSPATVDIIGVAYDRNFDRQIITTPTANNAIPTTLYAINRATGQLSIIGGIDGMPSPNGGVVLDIGALGFTLSATADGGFDIIADPTALDLNNGGLGRALAALTASDGVTRLYDIDLATGAATTIGLVGDGTLEIRSIAVVPPSGVTVGSGLGANGDARLLDGIDAGAIRAAVIPYAGFQGGTLAAAGDITGDGIADIVTAAVFPQGHVKVFDGTTGAEVYSFFAFENFLGTVNISTGDVNGDGFDDILVVANGVDGHVKAFSGLDGSLLASYLAYPGFTGDSTIASADFDLDGRAEIITAASVNGHVKVSNADGSLFTAVPGFISSFLAYDGFLGPVYAAGGDVTGDGIADIILATGAPTPGHVKVFSGVDTSLQASFLATSVTSGAPNGSLAAVATADVDGDGDLEILVTPGLGLQADVFALDLTGTVIDTFPAFANFLGGATVAGTRG